MVLVAVSCCHRQLSIAQRITTWIATADRLISAGLRLARDVLLPLVMHRKGSSSWGVALGLVAGLSSAGCDFEREEPLTQEEFRVALDEVVQSGEAAGLEDGIVEITTSFTLASGVQGVVDEVRAFTESQAPCAQVDSPEEGTLRIDFGGLGDKCVYRGRTYAGVVTVSYEVGDSEVVVSHSYDQLTNGRVTLDGDAIVTWTDRSRNVVTDFAYSGPNGSVDVQSDRTQRLLGGLGDGIVVVGSRRWDTDRGTWTLTIDDVEMRGVDPVPQAGQYTLTNPAEKEMVLSFERVDDDTISVTIEGPRRSRTFNVTSLGSIEDG